MNDVRYALSIMTDIKYSEKRRIGNIAEDIAEMFLVKSGYKIVERNYLKKWGELDIVAIKDNIIHLIEVKSIVTREKEVNAANNVSRYVSQNGFTAKDFSIKVTRETESDDDDYLPEDNVNYFKQKRILRTIETYILERNLDDNQEWQIDIITVNMDFSNKVAIIKHIENVIFEASR